MTSADRSQRAAVEHAGKRRSTKHASDMMLSAENQHQHFVLMRTWSDWHVWRMPLWHVRFSLWTSTDTSRSYQNRPLDTSWVYRLSPKHVLPKQSWPHPASYTDLSTGTLSLRIASPPENRSMLVSCRSSSETPSAICKIYSLWRCSRQALSWKQECPHELSSWPHISVLRFQIGTIGHDGIVNLLTMDAHLAIQEVNLSNMPTWHW